MASIELPLFVHWEKTLSDIFSRTEKFPKRVRFTFSSRIDNLALDILEKIVEARYAKDKSAALAQAGDFHALVAATKRAARGKSESLSTAYFLFHMEGEILRLQREILDGSYRPRPYRTFYISDPKPRTISAADFRDRVAHHSLCAVLEPLFERAAIFDSYACRPDKGSHRAVRRAQNFSARPRARGG